MGFPVFESLLALPDVHLVGRCHSEPHVFQHGRGVPRAAVRPEAEPDAALLHPPRVHVAAPGAQFNQLINILIILV